MKLEQFIEESLKQIFNGINNADIHARKCNSSINPNTVAARGDDVMYCTETSCLIQLIEFDIAVIVKEENSLATSDKQSIGEIVVEGSLTASGTEKSYSHRIKFALPVRLPTSDSKKIRDY